MKKNNRIQFWRIVFTYVIAYYHLNNVYKNYMSWYIAVEFFFLVSGYLLAAKNERSRDAELQTEADDDCGGRRDANIAAAGGNISAYQYVKGKYIHFFPHCLYSFAVAMLANGYMNHYTAKRYLDGFVTHLPEVFLVQSTGLNYSSSFLYNSVTWYISVLLICSYFIWYLLTEHPQLYKEVLIPLSILLIYPYLYRTYGSLSEHRETLGFFLNSAVLRGMADMNLGVLSFCFSQKIRAKNLRGTGIISDLLFVGVILLSATGYQTSMDFLCLALLFVAVSFAFSCEKNRCFDHKLIEKWSSITIAIYLNHKVFRNLWKIIWPVCTPVAMISWFLFITVYSAITYSIFMGSIGERVKKCVRSRRK